MWRPGQTKRANWRIRDLPPARPAGEHWRRDEQKQGDGRGTNWQSENVAFVQVDANGNPAVLNSFDFDHRLEFPWRAAAFLEYHKLADKDLIYVPEVAPEVAFVRTGPGRFRGYCGDVVGEEFYYEDGDSMGNLCPQWLAHMSTKTQVSWEDRRHKRVNYEFPQGPLEIYMERDERAIVKMAGKTYRQGVKMGVYTLALRVLFGQHQFREVREV